MNRAYLWTVAVCLLLTWSAGCRTLASADRHTRLEVEIESLPEGMDAREVYKQFGKPDLWGNWDGGQGFNTSLMTTHGHGPLPIPGEKMRPPPGKAWYILDWVYCLSDDGLFGKVAIIRFHDYKLHRTDTGHFSTIYDP